MAQGRGGIIEPDCLLCSGDYSTGFVVSITSASGSIGIKMSPEAFRSWLSDATASLSIEHITADSIQTKNTKTR